LMQIGVGFRVAAAVRDHEKCGRHVPLETAAPAAWNSLLHHIGKPTRIGYAGRNASSISLPRTADYDYGPRTIQHDRRTLGQLVDLEGAGPGGNGAGLSGPG